MKRSFVFVGLASLLVFGAGCQSSSTSNPSLSGVMDMSGSAMMGMLNESKLATVGDVLFSPEVFSPGTVTMSFKVVGNNGKAYTPDDLQLVHEKLIHVILVRKDMKVFRHEHPVYQKNGYWSFKTTIADPGEYYAYLDLTPKVDPHVVWHLPFAVRGKWDDQAPSPTPDLKVTVDGVQASLVTNKLLKVGQEATLDFSITKDGKPVKLGPYLGAFGHVVILRYQSPNTYLHVHPITTDQPTNGHVKFGASFPQAGRYSLFAQFNVNSSTVMTFPITIDVGDQGVNAAGYGQASITDMMNH